MMASSREPGAAIPAWLKVCVSCDRYAGTSERSGIGAKLADALAPALKQLTDSGRLALRRVPCLSGCRHPGNVMLGASGRAKLRLASLSADDAEALASLAARYAAGEPALDDWPVQLRGRLAAVMPA